MNSASGLNRRRLWPFLTRSFLIFNFFLLFTCVPLYTNLSPLHSFFNRIQTHAKVSWRVFPIQTFPRIREEIPSHSPTSLSLDPYIQQYLQVSHQEHFQATLLIVFYSCKVNIYERSRCVQYSTSIVFISPCVSFGCNLKQKRGLKKVKTVFSLNRLTSVNKKAHFCSELNNLKKTV